jgi:hypothetical protein
MSVEHSEAWGPASGPSAEPGRQLHNPGRRGTGPFVDAVVSAGPEVLDWSLLKDLQTQETDPSISVLLGTTPASKLSPLDVWRLHRLSRKALERLHREVRGDPLASLETRLARTVGAADLSPSSEGLGVFVSARQMAIVRLPFAPRERTVVDPTFATRDILFALQHFPRYRLVTLSGNFLRVLEGRGLQLVEVVGPTGADRSASFPRPLRNPGEGGPNPGRWTSALARGGAVIKAAERALDQRVAVSGELPVVVVAPARLLAGFRSSSRHAGAVIGEVRGDHPRASADELANLAEPILTAWRAQHRVRQVSSLMAAERSGPVVWGLIKSWNGLLEGRARHLWVDQGYAVPARLSDEDRALDVTWDPEAVGVNDDVVDDLIRKAALSGVPVDIVPWLAAANPAPVALQLCG